MLMVSTVIPGPRKELPGGEILFRWALAELADRLAEISLLARIQDALGPYVLLATSEPADEVKAMCVVIEDSRPAARLLDLDVYPAPGRRVGRAELGLPPRPCLLCSESAVDCMRLNRHPQQDLICHVENLLAANG
jgi:holo-ACP synthase CitX